MKNKFTASCKQGTLKHNGTKAPVTFSIQGGRTRGWLWLVDNEIIINPRAQNNRSQRVLGRPTSVFPLRRWFRNEKQR
jgi:hypothetical protein